MPSMTATENERVHWGEIDGVSIDFPMTVDSMRQATLTFTVPLEPARALVPGDAFEVLAQERVHGLPICGGEGGDGNDGSSHNRATSVWMGAPARREACSSPSGQQTA